jgi:class 3 adenylate cyclase
VDERGAHCREAGWIDGAVRRGDSADPAHAAESSGGICDPLRTYLVTDIEGSKKLAREAVEQAQSFVEQALSARGGRVVSAEGDAVVAWFATVQEAVRAAAALEASPAKVRVGIAPRRRAAERVSAAGYGGQVLLSLGARLALRRRLRRVGLGLYQLDPAANFPPPRRGLLRRLV